MHWHQCLFSISVVLGALRGGARTDFDGTESDHGTVDFVDDAIDLLKVVGVGDDLVAGDNVLFSARASAKRSPTIRARFCT